MLTRQNLNFYYYNLEYAWANVNYYSDYDYDILCEVSEGVSIEGNPNVKHYLRDFLNDKISYKNR